MKKLTPHLLFLCICLSMIISLSSCGGKPNLSKLESKYEAGFQTASTTPLSEAELETQLTLGDKDLISSGNYEISYSKRSATYSYDEWFMMGANDDIFYPGALLDLREESVKPLNIGELTRAPITISTNLETVINKSETDYTTEKKSLAQTISAPALSSTRDAIKTIVNTNIPDLSTFPSHIEMSIHEIKSKDEFAINLGLGLAAGNIDFSEKFDTDVLNKQTNLAVVFKQIYYSVDCDFPGSEAAFFDGTPSAKRLEGTLSGTVPAYISSVNYGRIVVMSIQTNYTKDEVINALSIGYNTTGFRFLTDLGFGGGINLDFTIGQIAQDKETKISYFEYGGGTSSSDLVAGIIEGENAAENFKKIFKGAHDPNAALPISYTIRHLDGTLARLEDTRDYTIKNVKYIPNKIMDWSALKKVFDDLKGNQTSLTVDLSRMVEYNARETEEGENANLYNANYTIVLPSTIKTFKLIGPNDRAPDIVYKNLSIQAQNPVHIILQDISFVGNDNNAAIYSDENKTMHDFTITCKGSVQVNGAKGMGALAVNGDVTLEVLTDAGAAFRGGDGASNKDGGDAINVTGAFAIKLGNHAKARIFGGNGGNDVLATKGGNGGIGVSANALSITMDDENVQPPILEIHGGNGGNGIVGVDGEHGKDGENGVAGWGSGSHGTNATNGTDGTNGGSGGDGACAVALSVECELPVYASLHGGNGGIGSSGGNGGDGGDGGDGGTLDGKGTLILDTGYWKGLNGGDAGNGGDGGNKGTHGKAAAVSQNVGSLCKNVAGEKSTIPLVAGKGGEAGEKGSAGYIYNHSWDHGTFYGTAGAPGLPGTDGE